MAETLTYDPTPADQPELNEEEQNSLEVGEKLAEQEGELLAGKYKDAQELESAYLELQKKLGSDNKEEVEKTEVQDESDTSETNQYLEDGSVNFEQVKNTYGDKLSDIFENQGIDPWEMHKHFHDNRGELTPEMKDSLIKAGLSESSVDAYLEGLAVKSGYGETQTDITEKQTDSIMNSVGGKESYAELMNWANDNVSDAEAEAYDSIVQTGKADAIQLALNGIKAKYDEANGYEGRMLTGKAAQSNTDVFRSQAEVVRAMNDPKYDSDPAYRQDVYDKLERSNVKF